MSERQEKLEFPQQITTEQVSQRSEATLFKKGKAINETSNKQYNKMELGFNSPLKGIKKEKLNFDASDQKYRTEKNKKNNLMF